MEFLLQILLCLVFRFNFESSNLDHLHPVILIDQINPFISLYFPLSARRRSTFTDRQTSSRVKTAHSRLHSRTPTSYSSTPTIQTKRSLTMSAKPTH